MPFTPSHVAAVLPFARTRLSFSALAVGSMAPDFPYYVPGVGHSTTRDLTHSAAGVVSVDVLLGLAVFVAWHAVLVPPARAALGQPAEAGLRSRLSPWPRLGNVVLSLVIGASTHVLWDSLTHAGSWGPRHLALLSAELGPLPGYRWAQYASGVLGLVAVALAGRRTLAGQGREGMRLGRPAAPALVCAATAAGATVVLGLAVAVRRVLENDVRGAFFLGITRGTTLGITILLTGALVWHLRVARPGRDVRSGAG